VECHGRGGFAEVVVRDNGSGISAETLQHVFDPVWQMNHARADGSRSAGMWLGLAVAYRIVELHGGRIFAASDGHGMGSVFTLRMPLNVSAGSIQDQRNEVVSGPFRSGGRVFPPRPTQPSATRK
jgi:signal transduction histidine kinase